MREALSALNVLVRDGTIGAYAIGGAVGASFYIDALQTEDVDAFVFLKDQASALVTLAPVYEKLRELGGVPQHEHVRFGEWPLQILTDATLLIADAIETAIEVEYEGVPTRVFRAEHLCAVALETGRTKDYLRVALFLERDAVDRVKLQELASKYGLSERLKKALDFRP